MRVLITTDLYTANINGVVTSVKNLISYLKDNGHEVKILTLSESTTSHKTDFAYFIASIPMGIYPNIRMPLVYRHQYINEIIAWKPEIIHSQCEFFTMSFAKRIARKTGAPMVHTYHTLYERYIKYVIPLETLGTKMLKWFIRKRLARIAAVIAPTEKIRRHLAGYHTLCPVVVVPSGINVKMHTPISPEARELKRKQLGIAGDEFVLVYVGRLAEEKNLEEILAYFTAESRKDSHLKLLIVGDGPYKKHLEKQANPIQEKVIFTGMIPPEAIHEYYQLGDVFVNASTSETQGLTYVEALMNGVPLLCRYDPCLEGVVQQGVNGFQYTDQTEFAAMLQQCMDVKWRETAAASCKRTAEEFTAEAFGERVVNIYRCVNGKAGLPNQSKRWGIP